MVNFDKVVRAFENPPPEDPERMLSIEEFLAIEELHRIRRAGQEGQESRRGLGMHGSLIGGTGLPVTSLLSCPFHNSDIQPLLPLAWFDYPEAHVRHPHPEGEKRAEDFFAGMARMHMAGMGDRPTGRQLLDRVRSADDSGPGWRWMYELLGCIRIEHMKYLLSEGGVSVYEIARALHLDESPRPQIVEWINGFAVRPDGEGETAWPT